MNELPSRVSVVVPTYMRETKYLSRALQSIRHQTYMDTEIVIIDDNHPGSLYRNKIECFMTQFKNDPNIIYLANPKNIGGALARNRGIEVATGDYITFLDDDDEYLPEKIEKQLKFMIDKDADMSFTDLKLVNENKIVVDYREYSALKNLDKKTLLKYHIMKHLTGTPTFMYRSEKLKEIGGFDDAEMGQEFYLMLKSIEAGLKIFYLNDCDVIAYRHRDGGISQGNNKICGENDLYEFKKQYFDLFTAREKMFIKFRHYAVMTIAYKRNKKYIKAVGSAIAMFLSSPLDFVKESSRFVFNIFDKQGLGN